MYNQKKITCKRHFVPKHFFLHLIAEGNCASKFKLAAVAIRLFKNETPKNQFNTGLAEQLGHWKMVSDDIGIEEPKEKCEMEKKVTKA